MQLPPKKLLPAFTLVELIVVITIVGILSTVGFVSYSGYLSGARDSNRISQLTKLSDSLQVYSASKSLPLPDNAIEITASGTLIAYQGEVGVDVLETIDYTNGGTDPKDDSYYTYYLTKDRNSLQLMALMEEQQSVSYQFPHTPTNQARQVHANFEERFPKVYGRKLGVLTYSDSANPELLNTPANQISANTLAGELDIVQTTTTYTANIINNISISGTGSSLQSLGALQISKGKSYNCREIYDAIPNTQSGIYKIFTGNEILDAMCDMRNDGGWTLIDGVSGKFGSIVATQVGGNPNIQNYSMPEKNLTSLMGRDIDTTIFNYSIKRGAEDLQIYISFNKLYEILKGDDYQSAENNSSISSESWITYNGGNIAQSKIKNIYSRIVLRSKDEENFYGHLKTYGSSGPHSWWIGKNGDYFGQLYLNKSLIEVDVFALPDFGGLFIWEDINGNTIPLIVTGETFVSQGYKWSNYPVLMGKGLEAGLWMK